MAITHTYTFGAAGGSASLSGIAGTSTGEFGGEIYDTVAASTTNQAYAVAIDVSELASIFLYTDGDLTVKTNSTSDPDQTLTFAANKPLVWVSGMPNSNPLTTDVTTLYLTNAGASTVTLRGILLRT